MRAVTEYDEACTRFLDARGEEQLHLPSEPVGFQIFLKSINAVTESTGNVIDAKRRH